MAEKKQIKGKCKGCGKPIIWLASPKTGKVNVPVNPEGAEETDVFFNIKKHVSHFATCVYASALRKKTPAGTAPRSSSGKEGVNYYPTAEEIERDREKVKEDFKNTLLNDKRRFILHNRFDITMRRYSLLNVCAEKGLGYDELVSYTNDELLDWLVECEVSEAGPAVMNNGPACGGTSSLRSLQGGLFE